MKQIESVIFDAGGVLHASNTAVTEDLMKELALDRDELGQIWREQIPLLGSGEITEEEFWRQVQEAHGIRNVTTEENLLGRAFAETLSPYPEVKQLVQKLGRRGVVTGVLSNTIEPHARALYDAGVYDGFNGPIMLSHEVGLRKPSMEMYEYALEQLEKDPATVMFVDDDIENVAAAVKAGMWGLVYRDPDQLREELDLHFHWRRLRGVR